MPQITGSRTSARTTKRNQKKYRQRMVDLFLKGHTDFVPNKLKENDWLADGCFFVSEVTVISYTTSGKEMCCNIRGHSLTDFSLLLASGKFLCKKTR